jgi:hypothetical protein
MKIRLKRMVYYHFGARHKVDSGEKDLKSSS